MQKGNELSGGKGRPGHQDDTARLEETKLQLQAVTYHTGRGR